MAGRVAVNSCQWCFNGVCEKACSACFHFAAIISCSSLCMYRSIIFTYLYSSIIIHRIYRVISRNQHCVIVLSLSNKSEWRSTTEAGVSAELWGHDLRTSWFSGFSEEGNTNSRVSLYVWKKSQAQVDTKRLEYYITQPFW